VTGPLAGLDDALARAGSDIVLRRVRGTAPGLTNYDVTVRAAVRSYRPEEIVGGISATDSQVIISPTQIAAAGWPGDGETGSPDPALPRINDKVVIAGRTRNIAAVRPFYVGDELVRIELQVSG